MEAGAPRFWAEAGPGAARNQSRGGQPVDPKGQAGFRTVAPRWKDPGNAVLPRKAEGLPTLVVVPAAAPAPFFRLPAWGSAGSLRSESAAQTSISPQTGG